MLCTKKAVIQAREVVYRTINAPHFHDPASFDMAATTPIQGKYIKIKTRNERATGIVKTFFPFDTPDIWTSF